MKRLVQIACSAIIALFALVPVVAHAEEQTSYTITSTVSKAIDDFITFAQDDKLSPADFQAQYPLKAESLESKIDDAVSGLSALNVSGDQATGTDKLIASLGRAKIALAQSRAAMTAGDEKAFEAALTDFDSATLEYNNNIDDLNKSSTGFTEGETTTLYYGMAIGTAVVSAAAFAWAFVKRPTNPVLATARRNLAISSLWPLAGALITVGTYIFSTDGTYFIAWGPIGIGVVLFVKGILDYVKLAKTVKA